MKKSEMYHKLQVLVLRDTELPHDHQLDMLRELMLQEGLARYSEDQEAKQHEDIQ